MSAKNKLATTVSASAFRDAVVRAARTSSAKTNLPILSCAVISADASGLTVRTTDGEMGTTVRVEGAEVSKPWSTCIHARDLADMVKDLPDSQLELSTAENHALNISAVGRKLKLKLQGQEAAAFPEAAEARGEPHAIAPAVLRRLIDATRYAMSTDDTRPHMCGLNFVSTGKALRVQATDGHRCASAEAPWTGTLAALLPHRAVAELQAAAESKADSIAIRQAGSYVVVEAGPVALMLKTADDQFPPTDRVVPKVWQHALMVPRSDLIGALKRMEKVARRELAKGDKSDGVRIVVDDGELSIIAENPLKGEGAESIAVDTGSAKLAMGVSARYLREALQAIAEDDVELCLSGELDPILARGGSEADSVHVTMPLRI